MSRIVSKTIDLSTTGGVSEVNKYITKIDDNGIKIHPKNWSENTSTYVQIDGEGFSIFDGIKQIAQYGEDAIIGDESGFHIKIAANYYAQIFNPVGNPSEQGWYELDNDEYIPTEDTTVIVDKVYYKQEPRLSFWRGPQTDINNEVAYISGDKLYITQSVVLQQMDVGIKQIDNGLGQWSWKVHEVDNQNNLYLKWLG